jgi:YD repeat-containing protein
VSPHEEVTRKQVDRWAGRAERSTASARAHESVARATPHLERAPFSVRADKPPAARPPHTRPEWAELLRDLGVEPDTLSRNAVPHRDCTRAGRFVDVATGKAIVAHRDFSLGASSPLVFERVWLSTSTYSGPLGHGWHHAYDVALACRANSIALRMSDGRVLWMPAPSPAEESFDADEQLRLSKDAYGYALRDAFGLEMRFVPHRSQAAHVLGSLRRLSGLELRFGYDHRARLTRITSRGDCDLELSYDRTDRIVEIQAPDPQHAGKRVVLVQYAYDARGNLRKASDALSQAQRYVYDRNLLTSAVDRNGCAAQFGWDGPDARARCVRSSIDAGTCDRTFDYTASSTLVRNSLGHATRYAHDGAVVQRVVDANGHPREYCRGAGRRMVRDTDALGHAREQEFDARGALTKVRGPDGATWSFERDATGRTLQALDPLAGRWQFTCDSRGRLTRWADPLGRVTRHHYRGRWLVGVTEPGDRHMRYAYDDAGNLESHIAADGTETRYGYDVWGQLTAIINARGLTQHRHYDVLGRLIRVREPDGNVCELAYDAEGHVVRCKDRRRDVKFTYQGTGQLSSRSEAGLTLCFEYDSEERLIAVVNEQGKVYRIRRDATGEIVETTGFDGCQRMYTRDPAGRITRVERAGEFSEYDFDAAGRVIEVQHSDGAFEGYRYRLDGQLMSAWNQDSTLVFERDAAGRVMREQFGEHTVDSQYDAAGRRTTLRSSLGAQVVLERNASGGLRRIAELTHAFEVHFERDALGLVLERTLPGEGRCVWQRDSLGRACVIRLEGRNRVLAREWCYEYEPTGRLRRFTDSQAGTSEYHYDARGNFAWLRGGDGSYQLRMPDAVGNPFGREDRRDREYGLAGQLLTRSGRDGEVLGEYDAAGNRVALRIGEQRWLYSWSASGRLRNVIRPDGSEVAFGYDALGRRVWKKHRGQITRFVWDAETLLHEWVEGELSPRVAAGRDSASEMTGACESNAANERALRAMLDANPSERGTRSAPITWLYDPNDGAPIARLCGDGADAILTDHQGAPRLVLDKDGLPRWAADTSISGELRMREGVRHACSVRGASLYEDLETGLQVHASSARYYDPGAGLYLSQGSLAAAPNLRAYVPRFALGVEWREGCELAPAAIHEAAFIAGVPRPRFDPIDPESFLMPVANGLAMAGPNPLPRLLG